MDTEEMMKACCQMVVFWWDIVPAQTGALSARTALYSTCEWAHADRQLFWRARRGLYRLSSALGAIPGRILMMLALPKRITSWCQRLAHAG